MSAELEPPVTPINSRALIRKRLHQIFGINGKEKQIEVLYRLVVEKKDTILLAKTGFGKSILFQAPPMLSGGNAIAIVLLPLLALQNEQKQKLERIGARPFVLNGDTNTPGNRGNICRGQYTHILTSPEIALSTEFDREILRYPEFSNRISLLAVDELHLVQHWGKQFRPDYMNIAVIRKRLPADVPMLGATATMNPRLLEEIIASTGFNSDVAVIRTALDRPEIFMQVETMHHAIASMQDLAFVLEAKTQDMSDHECIPKTIIFMESVLEISKLCRSLRSWMSRLNYPSKAGFWVQPFFSAMPQYDKDSIAEAFSKPSSECKEVRILICTDAYGLGVDNPDVARVIQYGTPENMEVLCQRAGRAMRSATQQAFFLMLVKPSLIGRKPNAGDKTLSLTSQIHKHMQQRADLSPGLYDMINTTKCLRSTALEFFNAVDADPALRDIPALCCGFCNPEHGLKTQAVLIEPEIIKGYSLEQLEKELRDWRNAKAKIVLPTEFQHHVGGVMLDKVLITVARHGPSIQSLKELRVCAGFGWSGYSKFGEEVFDIIRKFSLTLQERQAQQQIIKSNMVKQKEKSHKAKKNRRETLDFTQRIQEYSQEAQEGNKRTQSIIQRALESIQKTNEMQQKALENYRDRTQKIRRPSRLQDIAQESGAEAQDMLGCLLVSNKIPQTPKRPKKAKAINVQHPKSPKTPLTKSRTGRIIKPTAKMLL